MPANRTVVVKNRLIYGDDVANLGVSGGSSAGRRLVVGFRFTIFMDGDCGNGSVDSNGFNGARIRGVPCLRNFMLLAVGYSMCVHGGLAISNGLI